MPAGLKPARSTLFASVCISFQDFDNYDTRIPNPSRAFIGGSTLEFEMNDLIAAAKAVIDRWDAHHVVVDGTLIADLRAAVEWAEQAPENEPVAWITPKGSLSRHACFIDCAPLYRHPPRPTGLDQLLERIRFLEQQIAERKNQ